MICGTMVCTFHIQVHFILSGDDEETDARTFEDDQRKIFRRGGTDSFLLAVARSQHLIVLLATILIILICVTFCVIMYVVFSF